MDKVKWSELTSEQRDRLVAEKVMGWTEQTCEGTSLDMLEGPGEWQCSICGFQARYSDPIEHIALPPRYSTDMNVTWQIVEKMVTRQSYHDIDYEWSGPLFGCPCWYVKINDGGHYSWIMADTAQDAICIASLRAVGIEVER
jgi:Phage ABA sandwich domain